ncbi:MAG: glycosyl transferase group 1, partial [Humibacillus sp.]|nr:glycosyl transferase group 1 [Humibacillus sp.]
TGWGSRPGPTRLLSLGAGRDPRSVAQLLEAMRSAPDVTLTVVGGLGELGGLGARGDLGKLGTVADLAADPSLVGRVELREGPVPVDTLATLLAEHDVLVVSARSATTSHDVALAHAHGLPVLAAAVAPFDHEVTDGVDGLLVPPGDVRALTTALLRLADPDVRRALADGVHTPDLSASWAHYLGTIETLSLDASLLGGGHDATADERGYAVGPGGDAGSPGGPTDGTGRRLTGARSTVERARTEVIRLAGGLGEQTVLTAGSARRRIRRVVASRREVLDLRPDYLPEWVLPTDVLVDPSDSVDARRLARQLGLPRSFDAVAAWAALGALTAILRVRDDGRRSAVIVDESGARSLLSRWARAVGFEPVEIEFTGSHPSVTALDVDTGSLDVIVRIHPRGCDADDIDQVLEQASWALRSGGLLIVTVPIGPPTAAGSVRPADVRGILARAHDEGFVLVGDLDGALTSRMREASARARADDAAYGLVRLTLRRR